MGNSIIGKMVVMMVVGGEGRGAVVVEGYTAAQGPKSVLLPSRVVNKI